MLYKWIVNNDTYHVQMKAHTPYVVIACSKAFMIALDTLKDGCFQKLTQARYNRNTFPEKDILHLRRDHSVEVVNLLHGSGNLAVIVVTCKKTIFDKNASSKARGRIPLPSVITGP